MSQTQSQQDCLKSVREEAISRYQNSENQQIGEIATKLAAEQKHLICAHGNVDNLEVLSRLRRENCLSDDNVEIHRKGAMVTDSDGGEQLIQAIVIASLERYIYKCLDELEQ